MLKILTSAMLKTRIILGLLSIISLIIIGWGAITLNAKYQAETCRARTKEAIGNIFDEWADVMSRAQQSNQLNLQANISDLQSIKQSVSEINWPQCSLVAKTSLLVGMKSDIDQMFQMDEGSGSKYFQSFAWKIFLDETNQISNTGKSGYPVNSQDEAKKIVKDLFDSEINRITGQLESIQQVGQEYLAKSVELEALSEKLEFSNESSSGLDERLTREFNQKRTALINEGLMMGKGNQVIELELSMLNIEQQSKKIQGLREIEAQQAILYNQYVTVNNEKNSLYEKHKDIIDQYLEMTLIIENMNLEKDKYFISVQDKIFETIAE